MESATDQQVIDIYKKVFGEKMQVEEGLIITELGNITDMHTVAIAAVAMAAERIWQGEINGFQGR